MARWKTYLSNGKFELSVGVDSGLGVASASDAGEEEEKRRKEAAFWTMPWSYWRMVEQEGLMATLKESALVVFKGDLK